MLACTFFFFFFNCTSPPSELSAIVSMLSSMAEPAGPAFPTCSVTSRIHLDRRIACKIVRFGPLLGQRSKEISIWHVGTTILHAESGQDRSRPRPSRLRRSCRGRCGPALLLVQDCLFPDRAAQPRGQEAARSRRICHAGSRFSHASPPYFVWRARDTRARNSPMPA